MSVTNAADPNEIFTEGEDFITYSNDNGATWQMDIISDAMLGKNINIDYNGVPTGTANQSTSGFNLYLGENQNLNIKDMVLDLAGRLNFNITRDGGAESILSEVNNTLDYMDVKDLQLDGSITLVTNALNNKTAKNATFNAGIKTLKDTADAKKAALAVKEQLRAETVNELIIQSASVKLAVAKTLISSSTVDYNLGVYDNSAIQKGIYSQNELNDSTGVNKYSSLYSSLTSISNIENTKAKDYYYQNLYDELNKPKDSLT
jgi:hypothetical protein